MGAGGLGWNVRSSRFALAVPEAALKMKSVTLICPRLSCRAVLQVPDSVRGKRVRCAECGASFLVPQGGQRQPASKSPSAKSRS